MKPYEITLDLRRNIHQVLVMKEGDANSRIIHAKITDNGKPYDISSSYITVKWHKPDEYVVENIVHTIIDSNTIEIVCTDQMLAVAGVAKSEVVLAKNDSIISTMKFEVSIDKSVVSNNVIESSNEFGALNDLLAKNNSLGDDLRELESQLEKAESERVIAENERNANEEIRKTNENNREDAENLRESNTTTAIQNTNNATNLANTATQNAEDATEAAIDATTKTNEATQKANTVIAKMESLMKDDNVVHTGDLGVAGGVATLDEEGFLSKAQIPDRTIEIIYGRLEDNVTFVDMDGNVVQGGINKQYIDTATNLPYVWSGTEYVAVGSKLGLGYTSSSAFPGSDGLDLQKRMSVVEEYHNNIPASDIKFDNTNTSLLSAEVQGAIVELTKPATRTKDGLLSASDKTLIDNYANIQEIEAVLSASKWVGDSAPYTQTITITNLTAYNNCSVELNPTATTEQETAIIEADIDNDILYDESTGFTFVANGTKPSVDIPILICVGTSMNVVGVPYYLGDLDKAENISYDNSSSRLSGTNVKNAIDELDTELESHSHSWDKITDKPTTFTPSSHRHDDIYYTESEIDTKFKQVNSDLGKIFQDRGVLTNGAEMNALQNGIYQVTPNCLPGIGLPADFSDYGNLLIAQGNYDSYFYIDVYGKMSTWDYMSNDWAAQALKSDLGKMLPLKGGKMSGGIEMNGNVIGSVGDIYMNDKKAFLNAILSNVDNDLDKKLNKKTLTVESYLEEIKGQVMEEGLVLFRTNNTDVQNMHCFGSGIAFANSDTYGYLNFAYNTPAIYVGGGNNAGTSVWRDSLALKSDLDISSISSSINSTYFYSESENSESYISIRKSGKIAIANINLVLKTALTAGTEYALASLGSPSLYTSRSTANCGTKVVDLKIYNNDLNTIVIVPKENLLVGQCMRGQIMFFVK